ncbi:hypothetical protein LHP98_05400 [Rhodobacter sp. Har01]|uniref:hypothetical protein n=1 Tax=Rhodobacter sp. Har01 TaxID=2883999 RepID=UPI001D06E7F1|nr:hypothetical protein [Rhodobacter sp. Har01]MCB6177565.1 hypothetical protein [Rhodobacter sp. Har01]
MTTILWIGAALYLTYDKFEIAADQYKKRNEELLAAPVRLTDVEIFIHNIENADRKEKGLPPLEILDARELRRRDLESNQNSYTQRKWEAALLMLYALIAPIGVLFSAFIFTWIGKGFVKPDDQEGAK